MLRLKWNLGLLVQRERMSRGIARTRRTQQLISAQTTLISPISLNSVPPVTLFTGVARGSRLNRISKGPLHRIFRRILQSEKQKLYANRSAPRSVDIAPSAREPYTKKALVPRWKSLCRPQCKYGRTKYLRVDETLGDRRPGRSAFVPLYWRILDTRDRNRVDVLCIDFDQSAVLSTAVSHCCIPNNAAMFTVEDDMYSRTSLLRTRLSV